MVRLFSTILKREDDRCILVTPVEKCGIRVDDVPFAAVEMRVASGALDFRTNVGDWIACGRAMVLRFVRQANGGYVPYLHVRNDLWARVMRAFIMIWWNWAKSEILTTARRCSALPRAGTYTKCAMQANWVRRRDG